MEKEVQLQSGNIIVLLSFSQSQLKAFPGTIAYVRNHYDYLKNKLLVSFCTKATPEKEASSYRSMEILSTKRHVAGLLKRLNELELAQSLYNLLPKSQEIPENTGNW